MNPSPSISISCHWRSLLNRRVLNYLWWVVLGFYLAYGIHEYRVGRLCAYMATDFRGYYASAQIAWQRGFAAVYDLQLQHQYQAALQHRCPASSAPWPPIRVAMPYLPVFVLLFLPWIALDFSTGYLLWTLLTLAGLVLYLWRVNKACAGRLTFLQLLQWALCVPFLSNLFLGQVNLFLTLCTGEMILAYLGGWQRRSGLWLGLLLIKPQVLILLLPGLLVSQSWGAWLGFLASAMAIVALSLLLAGAGGVEAAVRLAAQFSGSLIQTGPVMMNWRALALNLQRVIPAWLAWSAAFTGMGCVTLLVLILWMRQRKASLPGLPYLFLATLVGTLSVTWHSHFYLLMMVLPVLLILDLKQQLPLGLWAAWTLAPPFYYLAAFLAKPDLVDNLLGLGFLALNLVLLGWSARHSTRLQRASPLPVNG